MRVRRSAPSGGTTANDFYSVSGVDGSAVATYSSKPTTSVQNLPTAGSTGGHPLTCPMCRLQQAVKLPAMYRKCNNLQQAIISVQVQTRGTLSPISLTQMKFDIVTTTVSNSPAYTFIIPETQRVLLLPTSSTQPLSRLPAVPLLLPAVARWLPAPTISGSSMM